MDSPLRFLFVAGFGRRKLGDVASVRTRLTAELARIAASTPDAQPVAVGSGAAGADQLFLEVAQSLKWPIRLVLPVAPYLFKLDFEGVDAEGRKQVDEDGLRRFEALVEAALDVEVVPPCQDRRSAFSRTSNSIVIQADVVVAVWSGKPGRQGGTNESLLLATQLGRPLVVIDADSGLLAPGYPWPTPGEFAAAQARRHAGILADVDHVLELGRFGAEKQSTPTTGQARFEAVSAALKLEARAESEQFRKINLRVLALHTAATTVGILALAIDAYLTHPWQELTSMTKLGLVATAVSLTYWLSSSRAHHHWVRARYVRELVRSLEATWRFPGNEWFLPSSVWHVFVRLRHPLLTFGAQVRKSAPAERQSIRQFLASYRESRLILRPLPTRPAKGMWSQREWHLEESVKAERAHCLVLRAFWTISVVVVVAAAGVVAFELAEIRTWPLSFLALRTATINCARLAAVFRYPEQRSIECDIHAYFAGGLPAAHQEDRSGSLRLYADTITFGPFQAPNRERRFVAN